MPLRHRIWLGRVLKRDVFIASLSEKDPKVPKKKLDALRSRGVYRSTALPPPLKWNPSISIFTGKVEAAPVA